MSEIFKPPVRCPECGAHASVDHTIQDWDGESVFLRTVGICVPCAIMWKVGTLTLRVIKSEPVEA